MKIIVNGALGRMGRALTALIADAPGCELAAAVDRSGAEGALSRIADAPAADVLIDFSHHSAAPELIDFAEARGMAVVMATTGHDEAELARIRAAAAHVPVFLSGNMSLGVALLCRMARDAARLFPEADIEIVEIHHRHKADAPSGTAKMLFHAVADARPGARMVCGRSGMGARAREEVGVHSLRMGEVVGVHEVHVSTPSQSLVLRHEAHSRALFAEGALCAAEFVVSQAPGLYDMRSLL